MSAPPIGVPRRATAGASVLLGYLALAALLGARAWSDPRATLLGSPQDAIQHIWFLRWLPFALAHGHDPLLTRFLDHPGPVNLMWNNATPLLAAVAAPITLTLGPVAAYLVLLIGAVTVSAWTAYLLAARLVAHRAAAWVAGLAYGFSPYVLTQATGSHLPLVTIPGPPLLLLCLHELVGRRRVRPVAVGVGVGCVLAAQLLTNEELLLTELLMGAVTLVVLAGLRPSRVREHLARLSAAAGSALVCFAVVAAAPLAVQLAGPARLGGGPVQPQGRYVADLLGFIVPTQVLHFAPAGAVALTHRFSANLSEWDAYLGLPLLGVMLVAPVVVRRRWAVAALLVGLVAGLLALGPELHVGGRALAGPLPWSGLAHLPGFKDVLPDRLTVYVFLAAALLLAGVLDRCRAGPTARSWARFTGVALAALLPLLPAGPLPARSAMVPAFFTTRAVDRLPTGRVALVVPVAWGPDDAAMLWQAVSGMRFALPFGYVLHPGPGGAAVADPRSTPLTATLHALQSGRRVRLPPLALRTLRRRIAALGAATVVVGPMPNQDRVVGLLTRLLGRPPARDQGVELWETGPGQAGTG
ncbi:MAG TPA: hypothetical protein VMW47_11555 [Verrucomicrobiae bacterium]|nr:hypothetical protein [Verrucomicrobiae bacterium]